jgi:hypothetical protein
VLIYNAGKDRYTVVGNGEGEHVVAQAGDLFWILS